MSDRFKGPEDFDWEAIHKVLAKKGEGIEHRILDENGEMVPATLMEWALWLEQRTNRIGFDIIEEHHVSTVFLGLDHGGFGRPLWFETMVFGVPEEIELLGRKRTIRPELWAKQCETMAEAIAAHEEGKEWLKNYLANHLS